MVDQENTKKAQLQEELIAHGFLITREELMELFVTENMHNSSKSDTATPKSISMVQSMNYANEIMNRVNSNIISGIEGSPEDIKMRNKAYGENKRLQRKIRTVCDMICEVFQDFILQVLCVAAVVSTVLGVVQNGWAHGFQEGLGILFAIVIIVLVTVLNDYAKEKKFQELMGKSDVSESRVRRNNEWAMRDSQELVVGDIVFINQGETIPADCLVLESANFVCSEAALTGEPDGLHKESLGEHNVDTLPDPFLLQSALCEDGSATALVLAVGNDTNQGRAGLSMNIENEETPLQMKLNSIANGIGKLGVIVAILTFIAIVVTTMIKTFRDPEKAFDMDFVSTLANGLVIAITVVVVAVPEGLPLAVTISLAYSVAKMADEKNLVRKLHSSETMGNANEICTDKTGTLTKNQMSVQSSFLEDQVHDGERFDFSQLSSGDLVEKAVIFNSTAFIDVKDGVEVTKGNVTEVGLIKYLTDSGVATKELITERDQNKPVAAIPFNSARKRATTAMLIDGGEKVRCFVKGAPEIVIAMCSQMIIGDGVIVNLSQEKKDDIIHKTVKGYAEKCLRTLLVSYIDFDMDTWNSKTPEEWTAELEGSEDAPNTYKQTEIEQNLIFVGIFGLKDPLREGILKAVQDCHKAGINVRMVTGDNIDTARAISLEAGIITQTDLDNEDAEESYLCMEGKAFREAVQGKVRIEREDIEVENEKTGEMETKSKQKVVCDINNMKKFKDIEKQLRVMARSQPDDKFLLVDGLIRLGRTVAVTGDGTNDAPALNRSDVGFAMGITGTDVAKSACDIQLTDDNFCSILVAVKYGRNIYDNVRKFLQFQLTVNVVAMFIVFAGACIFSEPPLTSTQMLWVNLIMDTFAALALATEPPNDRLMDRLPEAKSDLIVNSIMWRNIIGQSIFQIITLLVLLFFGSSLFGIDYLQSDPFYPTQKDIDNNPGKGWVEFEATNKVLMYTLIFQTFVFMQLFNQINARKLGEREFNVFGEFCNNFMFIFILILTFAVQMAIVQYGGRYMRAVPLTWEQNAICAGLGAFSLIIGLALKFVPARWFECVRLEERELTVEEEQETLLSSLRKSRTQRFDRKQTSIRSSRRVEADDDFKIN